MTGKQAVVKYGDEYYVAGFTEEDTTKGGTITVIKPDHKIDGMKFKKKNYVVVKDNYMGIGIMWLLWDIITKLAQEYNEWGINSLLTRERLALVGVGDGGQKLINNIIEALYSGDPVLNFDNVDIVDKIHKWMSC